jgi:RimJ/RimL family protein N-acetyltransferase
MKSIRKVRIETPRLILREFRPSDGRDVNAYFRFLPWGPDTPKQTKDFLKAMSRERRRKVRHSYELAVVLKSDKRVTGGCGIRIKNFSQREGDIGYGYHPDYWGNGYATEAARAIVDFGFTRLGLHRIWATHDPLNPASGRLLKRIGMKREGFLRSHMFMKGKWRSSWLYAILETDRRPKA